MAISVPTARSLGRHARVAVDGAVGGILVGIGARILGPFLGPIVGGILAGAITKNEAVTTNAVMDAVAITILGGGEW